MTRDLPSPELLRKLLRYEPETGKLFWKTRPREAFTSERTFKSCNSRLANREALTAYDGRGCKQGMVLNASVSAHRVAWALHYGHWPLGEVDHINGDKADNRIENLRDVSRGQNRSKNKRNTKMQSNNTSGCVGVSWMKSRTRWRAFIGGGKTKRHLGLFQDKADAISARKAAEVDFGYHENHGRAE